MDKIFKKIIEFKTNEEKYKSLNQELDKPFKFQTYYDNITKKKIFEGNKKNDKYEGRGILYCYDGEFNGYFKNGEYDGFGRHIIEKYKCIGFFKKGSLLEGIIYYNNIKKYELSFYNKDIGIGIEFLENGNIKRKMIYKRLYYYELEAYDNSYAVLYDENNNILYKGILKDFKPENAKNITIYDKKGIKTYKGDITNYKYDGKGIIYYKDSNQIFFDGMIQMGRYLNGIMYDPNGNKIYEGKFINNIPIKCKNIKLYNLYKELIYEGDILDGKYDGVAKIYKNTKILYDGELLNGKYNNFGKLYDYGKLIYEGEFLEGKYHGYGKTKIYQGYFKNGLYEGKGTLYVENDYEFYEAEFKKGLIHDGFVKIYKYNFSEKYLYFEGNWKYKNNAEEKILDEKISFKDYFLKGEINGKGIKYYENGIKKVEGIFDSLNSCDGIYYNPDGVKIYEGKILNDIPYESKKIIIYDDNTNIKYIGNTKNGTYEGEGIEYSSIFKDMILYNGEFLNNKYIIDNLNIPDNTKFIIRVTSYQRGYNSCELVEKLIGNKIGSFGCSTEGDKNYVYKYLNKTYKLEINYTDDIYY